MRLRLIVRAPYMITWFHPALHCYCASGRFSRATPELAPALSFVSLLLYNSFIYLPHPAVKLFPSNHPPSPRRCGTTAVTSEFTSIFTGNGQRKFIREGLP